jgi:hypothetical protein
MSRRHHRFIAICYAILAVAGSGSVDASLLTVVAASCTSFTLSGVAPNQTLDCVGGGVGGGSPMSLTLVDANCSSFTLDGVAPDQVLGCNRSASSAPILLAAASRRVHGAAGTFDLPLSLPSLNPSVEPRSGPTQVIVLTFDQPIASATAQVTEGIATAGTPTFSGNSVITPLTAVADQQYVTLSLTGVMAAGGGTAGNASVRSGFLAGDVNQSRVATIADAGAVNTNLSQPVTAANFVLDVNANGALTIADKGIANTNLTKALPAP